MTRNPFDRALSRDVARQIAESVASFSTLLAEWALVEMPNAASDIGKAAATDTVQRFNAVGKVLEVLWDADSHTDKSDPDNLLNVAGRGYWAALNKQKSKLWPALSDEDFLF